MNPSNPTSLNPARDNALLPHVFEENDAQSRLTAKLMTENQKSVTFMSAPRVAHG
jgi:hypothetical protein